MDYSSKIYSAIEQEWRMERDQTDWFVRTRNRERGGRVRDGGEKEREREREIVCKKERNRLKEKDCPLGVVGGGSWVDPL